MGYKHSYNIVIAQTEIRAAFRECISPYNDGFVTWGIKQDLYQLKWMLDEMLKECPTFGPEAEWLREQEQKKLIKILSNDI